MAKFYFPVVRVDRDGSATGLAGTAFPITPGGGLLTCRHVVDLADEEGERIPTAVLDRDRLKDCDRLIPIVDPIYLEVSGWDMAFLPEGSAASIRTTSPSCRLGPL